MECKHENKLQFLSWKSIYKMQKLPTTKCNIFTGFCSFSDIELVFFISLQKLKIYSVCKCIITKLLFGKVYNEWCISNQFPVQSFMTLFVISMVIVQYIFWDTYNHTG